MYHFPANANILRGTASFEGPAVGGGAEVDQLVMFAGAKIGNPVIAAPVVALPPGITLAVNGAPITDGEFTVRITNASLATVTLATLTVLNVIVFK